MKIIPVIDLKDGKVVAAKGGDRRAYAPISTTLAPGSSPEDVVRGLLAKTRAEAIYVADLDAIDGTGCQAGAVRRLAETFSQIRIWLDAGLRTQADLSADLTLDTVVPVVGSETLAGLDALADIDLALTGQYVLSLDFRSADFLRLPELLQSPELWPHRVIVMSLAHVGAASGPDLNALSKVLASAGGREIYAAGGVRNGADLKQLAGLGVSGALVSTALHTGTLDVQNVPTQPTRT